MGWVRAAAVVWVRAAAVGWVRAVWVALARADLAREAWEREGAWEEVRGAWGMEVEAVVTAVEVDGVGWAASLATGLWADRGRVVVARPGAGRARCGPAGRPERHRAHMHVGNGRKACSFGYKRQIDA